MKYIFILLVTCFGCSSDPDSNALRNAGFDNVFFFGYDERNCAIFEAFDCDKQVNGVVCCTDESCTIELF